MRASRVYLVRRRTMKANRVLLMLLSLLAWPEPATAQESYGRTPDELVPYSAFEPYRRLYLTPLQRYPSPHAATAPTDLKSVRIGLLAPLEGTRDDAAGLALLRGVELAFAEANQAGGWNGLPFELVTRNDALLWGSSANAIVDLTYRERVWAVIGSIDSNSTHVALRVALKCEMPIVNVGSTDPTVTETGIPWLIRCTPDDRQTGYQLAHLLFEQRAFTRVAVMRSSDRYGRTGVKEFADGARRLKRPLPMEILFTPGEEDFRPQLRRLQEAGFEALVIWSKAADAARLLRQMRALGMQQPVFGTDRMVTPQFLELAGAAAEGVTATAWMDPAARNDAWSAFRERFRARYQAEADVIAARGYDAAVLVIDGLRQAGLDRTLLRDELMQIKRRTGVAGEMRFDPTSNNLAPIYTVEINGGGFVLLSRLDAQTPAQPLKVGLFEPDPATADQVERSALLVQSDWNQRGGVHGRALRVVRIPAASGWQDGGAKLAQFIQKHKLCAVIGPHDADSAHVAAQVATRMRVPILTLCADPTLTAAKDPWIFRASTGDEALQAVARAAQAQGASRDAIREGLAQLAPASMPSGPFTFQASSTESSHE